jgi:hypothetical protein
MYFFRSFLLKPEVKALAIKIDKSGQVYSLLILLLLKLLL